MVNTLELFCLSTGKYLEDFFKLTRIFWNHSQSLSQGQTFLPNILQNFKYFELERVCPGLLIGVHKKWFIIFVTDMWFHFRQNFKKKIYRMSRIVSRTDITISWVNLLNHFTYHQCTLQEKQNPGCLLYYVLVSFLHH